MSSSNNTKREKGHTSYHPREGFALSVRWVLRNRTVAEEMLRDGLALCANATARDTPCVPLYFFRIAYDQTPATEYAATVKTVGDHPHYAKIFKSLEMNVPMEALQRRLEVGGVDPTPLSWGAAAPFDESKKAQVGFEPITISLTEMYLDSRSFFEHADSPDYLKAYGVIMQAHRSLHATSVCLGTPTQTMFETVLAPYLQAKAVDPDAHMLEFQGSNLNVSTGTFAFLEFSFDFFESWKVAAQQLFDQFASPIRIAQKGDHGEVRVEMGFVWNEKNASRCSELSKLSVRAGQLFVLGDDVKMAERPVSLPQQIAFYAGQNNSRFYDKQGNAAWAGYILHPKSGNLVQDETVVYKRN